jgi:hypothetical protein
MNKVFDINNQPPNICCPNGGIIVDTSVEGLPQEDSTIASILRSLISTGITTP